MGKCIYCHKTNVEFSKEHVIPELLGLFGTGTFTLSKKSGLVCKECNSKFGNTIDLCLAHDSWEGFERVDILSGKLLKPISDFPNIKIMFPTDIPDPNLRGVILDPYLFKNKHQIAVVEQVHLLNNRNKKYRAFYLKELEINWGLIKNNYSTKDLKIFGSSRSEIDEVIAKLDEIGISYSEKEHMIAFPGSRIYEVSGLITDSISRALCKIAFNYIAYFYHDKLDLYSSKFDRIKEFVKTGSGSAEISNCDNFLAEESKHIKLLTDGILIASEIENGSLYVKLNIYNGLVYRIKICDTVGEIEPLGYYLLPGKLPQELYRKTSNIKVAIIDFDLKHGGYIYRYS